MKQTFTVTGMTCGHCEKAVTRAVKQADPQAEVSIDRAANKVDVQSEQPRELLAPVARTDSGYRQYNAADVRTLQFIKRGRDLGFSMAEIAELVSLWRNRQRASASVKRIAQKHVNELAHRIEAMQAMQRTLTALLDHCQGDERPDCPILDDLAGTCC